MDQVSIGQRMIVSAWGSMWRYIGEFLKPSPFTKSPINPYIFHTSLHNLKTPFVSLKSEMHPHILTYAKPSSLSKSTLNPYIFTFIPRTSRHPLSFSTLKCILTSFRMQKLSQLSHIFLHEKTIILHPVDNQSIYSPYSSLGPQKILYPSQLSNVLPHEETIILCLMDNQLIYSPSQDTLDPVKTRVLYLVPRWRIQWYVRVYQSRDKTVSFVDQILLKYQV